MSELTIIGIGSPFVDDQLGWQVIERLQSHELFEAQFRHYSRAQLKLQQCDRPGVMLLEYLRDTQEAILVDAVLNKARPGEIVCLHEEQISSEVLPLSSHAMGVAEALMLGRQLGDLPAEISLWGITTDAGESCSATDEMIEQLCDRIISQVHHSLAQSAGLV